MNAMTSPAATKTDEAPSAGTDLPRIGTILVATDLSARSDRALERAVLLARTHDARLIVLHVMDEDLPSAALDRVSEAARDEIMQQLRAVGPAGGKGTAVEVVPGKDYRDIIARADEIGADLVITGTHRNDAGNKPITGTTMDRVIRHGTRPVLVVPAHAREPYRRVVVGVDFSAFSRFAIRNALAIAPTAEFHAVHAFQVPFAGFQTSPETRELFRREHERRLVTTIDGELYDLVGAFTPALPVRINRIVRHGDVDGVLRGEVDRLRPDLMVLGTHGRTGIAHALLGSVANGFLNNPPCDVLVVKAW